MKYIQLFEELQLSGKNQFWKVRSKTPYFEIALRKLCIDNDEYEQFFVDNPGITKWLNKRNKRFQNDYIYLEIDYNAGGIGAEIQWSGNKEGFNYPEGTHPQLGYHKARVSEYMGEMEITQQDIDEWQLEHDANKYNI